MGKFYVGPFLSITCEHTTLKAVSKLKYLASLYGDWRFIIKYVQVATKKQHIKNMNFYANICSI